MQASTASRTRHAATGTEVQRIEYAIFIALVRVRALPMNMEGSSLL